MAEPVVWDDGIPRSPRFDDRYRPEARALAQASSVFLAGCTLPQAWAGTPRWCVLETGFGLGLNFLATWQAWRDDPARPRLLHFVSIEAWPVAAADLLRAVAGEAALAPLAQSLAAQWQDLEPGVHRLVFEGGQVLLTLAVGDVAQLLPQLRLQADSVFLDGFAPSKNPAMWDPRVLQAVARRCRRGTTVASWTSAGAVRRALAQAGFVVERTDGLPPKRHSLRAHFDPAWQPRWLSVPAAETPSHCLVVGAGLAGSAAAASLARRGWTVEVLDAALQPAGGASALPAGLMAPHVSPDDNLLSRLSRAGVRATLCEARERLRAGLDWGPGGVLEHRVGDSGRPWPPAPPGTHPASHDQKDAVGLDDEAPAWWHERGAWIRPAALVRAWLDHPAIRFRGGQQVQALVRDGEHWQLLDAQGAELARAPLVVLAAAGGTTALSDGRVVVHPVRGQVSWGPVPDQVPWPASPVNGNGHFLPRVPLEDGTAWLCGSSYGRGDASTDSRPADHAGNLERLRALLPATAAALAPAFQAGAMRAWTGVRYASRDRRPLVGELAPGLLVATALGSRGLTFAALAGELLAARLHGEPLPIPLRLAEALEPGR